MIYRPLQSCVVSAICDGVKWTWVAIMPQEASGRFAPTLVSHFIQLI